jgi:hypothetical protein
MNLRALFVAKAKSPNRGVKGEAIPSGAPDSGSIGVFITPQSLMSFPVASLVVTYTWKLSKALWGPWADKPAIPVAASLVVGGIIFLASTDHPEAKPNSRKQWIVAGAVAVLNSLYLAAATLGLLKP